MAQQKNIQETQKKLLRRISELKTFNEKNRQISKKREEISKSAIDLTNANENKIEKASKEGQISDDHANHAKFLNSINYLVQENTQNLDTNKLNEINENLKKISKQISDYTKATIDKQDTSIKHAVKPDKKASDGGKSKPSKPSKKSKDGMGLFGWLGTGLAGLLGLLPFIPMIVSTFRFLKFLVKGSWKILKGGLKAILWVGKNIAHLVKLSGRMILGVVELFTHPLRFLQNYLAKPLKIFVSGIVGNMLSKIPGIKNLPWVQDLVNPKGSKTPKNPKNPKTPDTNNKKISESTKKPKTPKTPGESSKLFKAIKDWGGKMFGWLVEKIKPAISAIEKAAKETVKVMKIIGGKLWTIVKKCGIKLAAKAVSFIFGLAVPGPGWVLSVFLLGLFAFDFLWYLVKYMFDEKYSWYQILPSALVYALVGWDILEDDKEKFDEVEVADLEAENAAQKNISDYSRPQSELGKMYDAKKQAQDKLNSTKNSISTTHNGLTLNSEDARNLQTLKIQEAEAELEIARKKIEFDENKNNPKYLNGEILVSKENFDKMVNYMYDENKSKYNWTSSGKRPDSNTTINIERLKKIYDSWNSQADRIYNAAQDNSPSLRSAANIKSLSLLVLELIKEYNSGERNELNAVNKIKNSPNKFKKTEDIIRDLEKVKNSKTQQIQNFKPGSKISSGADSSKPASNAKTSANPNGNLGANYNPGATLQTSTFSAAAGTSRAVAAANYAAQHFGFPKDKKKKYGNCAKAVNDSLVFGGGWSNYGRGHPFQTPASLAGIGWTRINYSSEFKPKIGDIAVTDKFKSHSYGHISIMTSKGWVSDFLQNDINVYGDNSAPISIWRDTGNSTFASDYNFTPTIGKDTSPTLKPNSPKPTGSAVSSNPVVANASSNSNTTINNTQASLPIPKSSTTDLTDYWELQV